jgi:hypothetical protein
MKRNLLRGVALILVIPALFLVYYLVKPSHTSFYGVAEPAAKSSEAAPHVPDQLSRTSLDGEFVEKRVRAGGHGSIVVDGGGICDGHMNVTLLDENSHKGSSHTVTVRGNSWDLPEARANQQLLVHEITLNGRLAYPDRAAWVFPEDLNLTIPVSWGAGEAIRVVDGATWEDLSSVQVVECTAIPNCRLRTFLAPHPGMAANESVGVQRAAPMQASDFTSPATYLVTASGYAWARFQLMGMKPAPSTVVLWPGGDLLVDIRNEEGWRVTGEYRLSLFDKSSGDRRMAAYEFTLKKHSGVSIFSHLRPGAYHARLDVLGEKDSSCTVVRETDVVVGRSRQGRLKYDLSDLDSSETMVAGVVYAPAGRSNVERIQIEPLEVYCASTPQKAVTIRVGDKGVRTLGEGHLEWDPIPFAPGRYMVVCQPIGYCLPVVVPPEPLHLLEIDPPALLDIVVSVVDANGEPASFEWVSAASLGQIDYEMARQMPLQFAPLREDKASLSIKVCPGLVRFSVGRNDGSMKHFYVAIDRPQSIALELEAYAEVDLKATVFGQPVALSNLEWTGVTVKDAEGERFSNWTLSLAGSPVPYLSYSVAIRLPLGRVFTVELAGIGKTVSLADGSAGVYEAVFELSETLRAPR